MRHSEGKRGATADHRSDQQYFPKCCPNGPKFLAVGAWGLGGIALPRGLGVHAYGPRPQAPTLGTLDNLGNISGNIAGRFFGAGGIG